LKEASDSGLSALLRFGRKPDKAAAVDDRENLKDRKAGQKES